MCNGKIWWAMAKDHRGWSQTTMSGELSKDLKKKLAKIDASPPLEPLEFLSCLGILRP